MNFEKHVEELIMIPTLEPMHMDLIHLIDCILISSEQHNPQALIYVHRILHDLDYHWFNDYSDTEKPYGVTHIVTGSLKVQHFIKQQDYKPFMERQLEGDRKIQQNR